LVAGGLCIYHGPADGVLGFFSSAGYQCEEHDNPADFILDVCQGESASTDQGEMRQPIEIHLNEVYSKTDTYQRMLSDIEENNNTHHRRALIGSTAQLKKSLWNEIIYVSQRTLRNAFRNPQLTFLQTFVSIILSVLIGLIFLRLDHTVEFGIGNRSGAIFFIVTNQVFSNLSALELFIQERALFVHENVSGYYHVITYFISKILCDILPLRTIPVVGFSVISYFMIGFQQTASKFFLYLFCLWLTSITASALCFFVSASVSNFGKLIELTFECVEHQSSPVLHYK
jgi:ATP-binding cassette, subfamily G (WHITE), member 2